MPSAPPWIPVCEPLDWELSSVDVLRLLGADSHPAALLGTWAGGSDIVCSEPTAVCTEPEPPWAVLDQAFPAPSGGGQALPAFAGGWIGYLGFGLSGRVLPVPPAPGGARRLPSWWLGFYDHVLRRDRASGRWFFEALQTPDRAAVLAARLRELRSRARAVSSTAQRYRCGEFQLMPSATGHRSAVRQTVDYIRQGDIFQANICLRLEASFDGDPLDAFCTAAAQLDPPYAAFLRPSPDSAVASLSPELFLRRQRRRVSSRPIKGTAARLPRLPDAEAERARLERSVKNRAENVMIVDLMRSDLSRVCEPGSVEVPMLTAAEPHPGVWHLVSEVTGKLSADATDSQLIRATFPPGSVTGAPKVRALEVIHELEAMPREVYTGAVGYRSPIAGLELNVAIRTFEFRAGRVWLGAGGGIVAASRPGDEYRECLLKAGPLVAALGGRIATETKRDSVRPGAPDPALLPRPAAGVFTSVAVRAGAVHQLGRHLGRLAASARQLYGKDLPASLHDDLTRCLQLRPSGRLRITVRPLGGPLHASIEVIPLADAPAVAADLAPVFVPGGIGAHKWADRRLLARAAAEAGGGTGAQLLIEDTDGQVLESDRANVFAVAGGVLRTPPADGRLLPGVARAAVIELAMAAGIPTEIVPLSRSDLTSASEVFLTNSVRGVQPVRSIAGTTLPDPPGPVTVRLATALADARDTARPGPAPGPASPAAGTSAAGGGTRGGQQPRGGGSSGRRTRTTPTVVVLDNYDSFTYNLVHYLVIAGCACEVVRNDEVTASQILAAQAAGLVISPGPCAPAEAGVSIDAVRACAAAGLPVLGVCLGHQAIAASFGARIVTAPRPVHGQTSVITHDGRGVLAGMPRRFAATRYHSLMVAGQTLPDCLRITAQTRGGIPMGLRHATLPIEGVQFHPESILTIHGQAIIDTFARALRR